RSDQYSFVKQGIPAIWVWRGRDVGGDMLLGKENYDAWFANNYHRPSDDMNQPMSERGLLEELQLNFLMTYYIANEMQSIDWYEDSFLYQRYGK
ncbi:MAG: M28 family peptidase, partial [Bacteroidota bacterium]